MCAVPALSAGASEPDARAEVAARACAALSARVSANDGSGPVLLRSYDAAAGGAAPESAALRTAAFSYDNALAAIALLGCGDTAHALRVGEALRLAAINDTRLRNAYRAGTVTDKKPLDNGWWDAGLGRWSEDAHQNGTSTGNVAWVALALLALDARTHDTRWREAALHLARWALANTAEKSGAGGYSGGIDGFDAQPQRVTWRSTEHNIDLAALFAALAHGDGSREWPIVEHVALRFVASQWDATETRFLVGTLPDGATPNRAMSALDVQLWALLLPQAQPEWRSAIAYVERVHGVLGGFDFNDDRDGVWLEGTAQAALVYRVLGRERDADALLATLAGQFSTNGMVYATREGSITTSLALGAGSTSADFRYYRLPHLGATAWAALAARGRNPFTP